jgi:RNA polymerase sigma-70 factor (ECF subfamily)
LTALLARASVDSMSRPASTAADGMVPFATLAQSHLPVLRGYAHKLCGNEADAGDLVQDALERGLRNYATFSPGGNARAWLCTILYNVFVDRMRQRKARSAALLEVEHAAAEAEEHEPPQWAAITTAQVTAALADLDEEFRVVAQLRIIDGLSYGEIAERLSMPRNTVGTRLLRARERLRSVLERHLERPR